MTIRILFVDDEQLILSGLRRMLRPYHKEWDMTFVDSGEQALAVLEEHPFDLIISDVRMPGMDGIELLTEVRDSHPDLIRIILSGYSDHVDTLRSTTVAHQYLAKPCDPDVIRDTVIRATGIRGRLTDPDLLAAIGNTESLPSAPVLYQQLTDELASDDPSIGKIGEIVAQDPAMSAKILQIVNSAFFALRREVADINQAVTMLGTDTIMALALTAHLFSQDNLTSDQQSVVEQVWTDSLKIATLAKALTAADGGSHALAQEAFLAGLLLDSGVLVLVMNYPEHASAIRRLDVAAERETFGADHSLIGAYLLNIWGLPDVIVEAVAYHHTPSLAASTDAPVLTYVHAADALHRATAEQPPAFDHAYLESAGLDDRPEEWAQIAADAQSEEEAA